LERWPAIIGSSPARCVGWAMLLFALRRQGFVTGGGLIVPVVLSLLYCAVLGWHWQESDGGFGSLSRVARLFADRWLLLAGWIHYLAFDLFIGGWIVTDSERHHVGPLLRAPCLLLTFVVGPAGLLLYLLVRVVRMGRSTVALTSA
jgi:hypothetical protein